MKPNRLKARLASGAILHGVSCSIKDPAILEILALAGYNFAMLEMEHNAFTVTESLAMVRAADAAGIATFFRVAYEAPDDLLRAVDIGADGVIIAHARTAADARTVVNMAKYPPIGGRGLSTSTRAARYGDVPAEQHMQTSNDEVLAMVMIEDQEAVENLQAILGTPGLDGILIGPADLSFACGVPGQARHPKVQELIEHITTVARTFPHIIVDISVFDPADVRPFVRMGARMIQCPSSDTKFLLGAFREALAGLKRSY